MIDYLLTKGYVHSFFTDIFQDRHLIGLHYYIDHHSNNLKQKKDIEKRGFRPLSSFKVYTTLSD